jgi:hypothetical protein
LTTAEAILPSQRSRPETEAGDDRFSSRRANNLESVMSAALARILPRASATSIADIDAFITVALFSGIGLVLSLSVVILDQYIPGEWF